MTLKKKKQKRATRKPTRTNRSDTTRSRDPQSEDGNEEQVVEMSAKEILALQQALDGEGTQALVRANKLLESKVTISDGYLLRGMLDLTVHMNEAAIGDAKRGIASARSKSQREANAALLFITQRANRISENLNRAYLNHSDGRIDLAQDLYAETLTLDPSNPKAKAEMAMLEGSIGHDSRAFALADELIAVKDTATYGHLVRGLLYYNRGKNADAEQSIEAALLSAKTEYHKMACKTFLALAKKEYDKVLLFIPTWRSHGLSEDKVNLISALSYTELGEPRKAIAEIDQFISRHPDIGIGYWQRAMLLVDLRQFKKAEADLSLALTSSHKGTPDQLAGMRATRAVVRAELCEYEGAISDCSQLIDEKFDPGLSYSLRGFIYAKQFAFQKAVADLNRAIDDYGCREGDILFGRGCARFFNNERSEAECDLSEAATANPENHMFTFSLQLVQLVNQALGSGVDSHSPILIRKAKELFGKAVIILGGAVLGFGFKQMGGTLLSVMNELADDARENPSARERYEMLTIMKTIGDSNGRDGEKQLRGFLNRKITEGGEIEDKSGERGKVTRNIEEILKSDFKGKVNKGQSVSGVIVLRIKEIMRDRYGIHVKTNSIRSNLSRLGYTQMRKDTP